MSAPIRSLTRIFHTRTPLATKMTTYPTSLYTSPRHASFPYTASDFSRLDPSPDTHFYAPPRFVTHIDDAAIAALQTYYAYNLPKTGRILDLCSSWISHFPPDLAARAESTAKHISSLPPSRRQKEAQNLEVIGLGMNAAELGSNPVLSYRMVKDLNDSPSISLSEIGGQLVDAATCVVSIDYLTQPVVVLDAVRGLLKAGGIVHLVLSNRCFPSKAVARWLKVDETERTLMVADYLWWAGFRAVEILTVVDKGGGTDPLWVVRGRKDER